jgi:alkanesulfonate monooxygenase SsuD/methylene tetrahydromethanopterin reductase-like flavin-dependent oxidoreductase (luciferase family)
LKLGVSLPVFTADPARPLAVASRAAALGVDGVFSPDHLFPPVMYPPSGPSRPALEAFTLLAAVATANPRLRVGTLVTRVTLRPAGLLAKQAAALDRMCEPGAILGIGAGDWASVPEHEVFSIPFPPATDRVELLEETASALRALFAGDLWQGGEMLGPIAGPLLPAGSPEIWVGGLSNAVVRVAARRADIWNGWGLDAEGFRERAMVLQEAAGQRAVAPSWGGIALVGEDETDLASLLKARERAGLSLEGTWTGTAAELRAFAEDLASAGSAWFVVLPVGPDDRLELILETLSGI